MVYNTKDFFFHLQSYGFEVTGIWVFYVSPYLYHTLTSQGLFFSYRTSAVISRNIILIANPIQ